MSATKTMWKSRFAAAVGRVSQVMPIALKPFIVVFTVVWFILRIPALCVYMPFKSMYNAIESEEYESLVGMFIIFGIFGAIGCGIAFLVYINMDVPRDTVKNHIQNDQCYASIMHNHFSKHENLTSVDRELHNIVVNMCEDRKKNVRDIITGNN